MKKGTLLSLTLAFTLLTFILLMPVLAQTDTAVTNPAPSALTVSNSGTMPDEDNLQRAASKMDEALLSQLRNAPTDEHITAIVRLGGQADLSFADQFNDQAQKGAYVVARLQAFANQSQADLRLALDAAQRQSHISHYRPFFIFNGLAITAQPATLWQIALRHDVESVTANHTYQLDSSHYSVNSEQASVNHEQSFTIDNSQLTIHNSLAPEWNIVQINADDVWAQHNITGTGVLVANMDSGVQYNHPALVAQYAGHNGGSFDHNFHWYDATTGGGITAPYDDNGHGTHTMGTAVGGDGLGPFADDIGVAPGASWIAVKAFSAAGTGESADIHAAFEWLIAPCPAGIQPGDPSCDPARAPRIVNNSWGNDNGARVEFLPDVQALRAAGIWPAFSAGNNGPGEGTIGSPGSFAEAFASGATDNSDMIASFSSRGPSPLTSEIKPDVTAPGVAVRSSLPGGSYGSFNGTSMASPHSTGLGALLLNAAPNLDLDTLEELIRDTAVDLGPPGPDTDYGYGRIDALAAMQRIVSSGDLTGMVRDANTMTPITGAEIRAQGQGLDMTITADATGIYSMTYLLHGPYTVTATYYGYQPLTLTNVLIVTGTVTTADFDLVALPQHTLSGHVYDAISPTIPVTNAVISVLDTPLPPVQTDATGFYSLTVAAGTAVIEAAAFGYGTGFTATNITADTVVDFSLDPLPPILLVDDDEGNLRSYSPHVESFYFTALDANGYNYTYWDIEALGAPDFDTIRQYAAVVWFGGEFGRIKDISDAAQAQAVMDYLDIGGRFFYIAQEHTFYYGDDSNCDSPTWGGTGPCPFTKHYLGVADWIEDQKADTAHGVTGNPVGDGLGPYTMIYPPGLADFTDDISGTIHASLAFTATDDQPPGQINRTTYTVVSPTHSFKTVFMATPLEAMNANDRADVMYAVMEWFGISGLAEGLTLSPPTQAGLAAAGDPITYTLRIRNLSDFGDSFSLAALNAPWPLTIMDSSFSNVITELGPIAPQATADFGVVITVPVGTPPGQTTTAAIRATSQSPTPYSDEAQLTAQSRMIYYVRDSDQCDSGVHFEWVDARSGDRWDLDEDHPTLPEFVSVPLPESFLFYNRVYDHLWLNDHGSVLFGDDNIYDDRFPSGTPPIPNPTILDPDGAIHIGWGNSYWHPSGQDPETAVYTYHDTSNGRNWFIIEYYRYPNLLGDEDTMEIILDLDTNEITMLYDTISYHNFTVVGIEEQNGLEGILYVNDQQPPENILHDGLAIHYGLGDPPDVLAAVLSPAQAAATGSPASFVEYSLTLSSTSSVVDTYALEAANNQWPVTLWDETFSTPITEIGPLSPCSAQQFGVRVEVPNTTAYAQDTAVIRARSQLNPLIITGSSLTTDNAAPDVLAGADISNGGISGAPVTHTLRITNTGNVTDVYNLSLGQNVWPIHFVPQMTQTTPIEPGESLLLTAVTIIPPETPAGQSDTALFSLTSQNYASITDSAILTTQALPHIAVSWDVDMQNSSMNPGLTASYFINVRNEGNLDDVFNLQTIGAEWATTIYNDSFTQVLTQTAVLGPNETQRIGVWVQVPATALVPEQDGVMVQAVSTLDDTVSDYTMLVTAVAGASTGVQLTPTGDWQLTSAGTAVPYTLIVSNTGTTATSYNVTVSTNWSVDAPSQIGPIAANSAATLPITVHVPGSAPDGAWDEALIEVSAEGNTAVADQATLFTLLPETIIPPDTPKLLYLPFISKP